MISATFCEAVGSFLSSARVQQTLRMMLQCPPYVAIAVNRAVVRTDFRAELRRIATPTLEARVAGRPTAARKRRPASVTAAH